MKCSSSRWTDHGDARSTSARTDSPERIGIMPCEGYTEKLQELWIHRSDEIEYTYKRHVQSYVSVCHLCPHASSDSTRRTRSCNSETCSSGVHEHGRADWSNFCGCCTDGYIHCEANCNLGRTQCDDRSGCSCTGDFRSLGYGVVSRMADSGFHLAEVSCESVPLLSHSCVAPIG